MINEVNWLVLNLTNFFVLLLFMECYFLWVLLLLNSFIKLNICYFNKIKFMIIIWIDKVFVWKCVYIFEIVGFIKFMKMFKNSDEIIVL